MIQGQGEGSRIKTLIDDIKIIYPDNIWKYYSPDYKEQLLNDLDNLGDDGT